MPKHQRSSVAMSTAAQERHLKPPVRQGPGCGLGCGSPSGGTVLCFPVVTLILPKHVTHLLLRSVSR